MAKSKKHLGKLTSWGSVLVWGTVAVATGCGSDTDESDCRATRTCAPGAGGDEGGGGEPGQAQAGAPSAGDAGAGGAVEVAEPNGGGAGGGAGGASEEGPAGNGGEPVGGGGAVGCRSAMECSNDDPADGVEVCVAGECGPGNAPPRIVDVTPKGDELGAEPNVEVVLQPSEPLDPATVTAERVQLLDGGVAVSARVEYVDGVIRLTPSSPLRLRGSYQVKVSEEVADVDGAGLLTAFESSFGVRDGSWHAIDAARGTFDELAPTLPLLADGRVLLGWAGSAAGSCPASLAWVPLGATSVTPTSFSPKASTCSRLIVAAGGGSAAASWSADGPSYVQQERGGRWLSAPTKATPGQTEQVKMLGLSPTGVLTRFEVTRGGVSSAMRTNTSGTWEAQRDPLSQGYNDSPTAVAYDSAGNGLAVWVTMDAATYSFRVVASRFDAAKGRWEATVTLPGSVTKEGEDVQVLGTPSIAMAPSGEAMVVWRAIADGENKLMASYFVPDLGWGLAEVASQRTKLPLTLNEPGLAFDGERFVAAWVGSADGKTNLMFTASYAPKTGWSAPVGHDAKKNLPFSEFPRLASDSHGGLLLVWRVGAAPSYTLVHRRFLDGQWGSIEAVPGSTITDARTYGVRMPALSMNQAGVAALSWASYTDERISTIRLATFH